MDFRMSDDKSSGAETPPGISNLINTIVEPTLVTDPESRILAVNQALTDLFGFQTADLQGQFWTDCGPASTRPTLPAESGIPDPDDRNVRISLPSSKGSHRSCLACCRPVVFARQLFLIQTLHAITTPIRGTAAVHDFLDRFADSNMLDFSQAMTRMLLGACSADLAFTAVQNSPSEREFTITAIATGDGDQSTISCNLPLYDTTTRAHTIAFTPDDILTAFPDFTLPSVTTPPMCGYVGYEFDLHRTSTLDRPLKGHIGIMSRTPLSYSLLLHDSFIVLGDAFQGHRRILAQREYLARPDHLAER